MRASTRKAVLFTTLAAVVAFVLLNSAYKTAPSRAAPSVSTSRAGEAVAAQPAVKGEASRLALGLPERAALGEPSGALFGSQSWQPPAPKVTAAAVAPSAPPVPYRFAGKLVRDGTPQIFLAKGNVAIPIRLGQTIDGTYRVEAIGEKAVTLVYLPLNHKESIALRYSTTVAARPAAGVPNRDETQLVGDFGRWTQLSQEERRQINEYLAQIPPSPARDKLMQEYRRQVWGLQQ